MKKRIFLTGASAGIGLAATRALVSRGHEVWGTSRDISRLPSLGKFHPVALDLRDPSSIRTAYLSALAEAKSFDVIINNAGNGIYAPLAELPPGAFREQFDTLVHGPMELIRLALPGLRITGGTIVNITSLAARFPIPFLGTYSACKAALSSATETLRLELTGSSIHVVDLQPGDIHTRFHDSTVRATGEGDKAYEPGLTSAWNTIDKNMAEAPSPEIVAQAIVRIVESENPPAVLAVGNFFQAHVAPFLTRIAARAWVQWGLRVFYGLK